MCTSITLENDHSNYLARTMDFGFELDGKPVVVPRQYTFTPQLGETLTFPYGFVGTGRKLGAYLFADGVNEKGLAIAELYFPTEASYLEAPLPETTALAPHEFIMWVLGNISSIEELKNRIHEVSILNTENQLLGVVLPLHFIVADSSGQTVVVETHDKTLTIKENPVHVMTNSPRFEWHLQNLNNYLSLQPQNFPAKTFGKLSAVPFGQGSGTYGLPGGYTSPERFVRAVYLRNYIISTETADEALTGIFHILDNVTIPKGVNLKNDGSTDYTQYRAAFDTKNQRYYFNPYHTPEVFSLQLTEALLNSPAPIEYDVPTGFTTTSLGE
ncbi:choloylglycine hydrolase family protein [Enterococcus sp. BWM-S5]|uniref:Choloylglycine hydrolase family protein n=1 Tax=Enterococcus larvae TaxID=2794352 RepID=A0ABS4CLF5_9ENTE|nr:choloylglycine hydrolase family protein [Enterococcus larvae]MBP1047430.1 choloylglycine hydrolase family protein [Enterococcus larvae]